MARKRNSLLVAFPPGTITTSEASDALRQSGGDIEAAKRILEARSCRNDDNKPTAEQVDPQRATAPAATRNHLEKAKATAPATTSTKGQFGNEIETPPTALVNNNINNTNDQLVRIPPRTSAAINNLSDRQYCCVWHVEVYEDGYRPDVARTLLAQVARHVNPILRARGWRVKRLIESSSKQWIGLCTGNGRDDADAASTNIQLNLRVDPSKRCKTFRTFAQILSVMLHEITHTSIGLEDIHPPAFYELLQEIKAEYKRYLENGEVDLETDDYGCSANVVTVEGQVTTVREAAAKVLSNANGDFGQLAPEECGASKRRRRHRYRGGGTKRSSSSGFVSNIPKKRPLLKGSKMIDQRTKAGKVFMEARRQLTPRELAARAALERFGASNNTAASAADDTAAVGLADTENHNTSNDESQSGSDQESEDEAIEPHIQGCGCRGCGWERMLIPAEP